MSQYGDVHIKQIKVCKKPIIKTFETILNMVSMGEYNQEKEKLNYDNMFHLYLLIKLDNNVIVRLEKNNIPNIGIATNESLNYGDCIQVSFNENPLTLKKLLNRLIEKEGVASYLYDPVNNNCQIFIDNILTYSNINSKEIKEFVLQDTATILKSIPSLTLDVIKNTINFTSMLDILIHGKGF